MFVWVSEYHYGGTVSASVHESVLWYPYEDVPESVF